MIEHEQFSEFSLPFMIHVLPRGKMIQLTTHLNILKNEMVLF